MSNQTALTIIQKYIVLATGAPGSNIVRNEVIRLFEQTNDLSQVDELVDTFMFQQAQANEKGIIGVIQDTAYNGFGLNFSDEETQQLITDLVAQGIDSWSKLFAFATTAVHENLSTILDNRSEAANRFTDLLAELDKDGDYDGSQATSAAREWIAGIGASDVSLYAANNGAQDLINSFIDGNVQGRAFDGYISGATVFIDINQDGVLTPGEISTTTDALGHFMFKGNLPDRGLVLTGGIDIATNQPFTGTLSGSDGAFRLSPLTTLVHQLLQNGQAENIVAAEDILFQSLGIPRIDLSSFDPIEIGLNPDASAEEQSAALQLQATTAQISNLLTVSSTLISNVAGVTGNAMQSMAGSLREILVSAAQNDQVVDLADLLTLEDIITTGAAKSGIIGNVETPINQIATVLSEINTITQQAAENSNTDTQTAFSNIVKFQTLIQAQIVPDAVTALETTGELSTVVTEFTGDELIENIDTVLLKGTLNAFTQTSISALADQLLQNGQVESSAAAEDVLFQSLDIPEVDLSSFDPIDVGLDPDASAQAQSNAVQLQAITAQISNFLSVASALIDNVDDATGDTMQSVTNSLLDALISAAENNQITDLTDTQILETIIIAAAANEGITGNIDTAASQIATILAEINTITQQAAENNDGADVQTVLSDITKLQALTQTQLIPAVEDAVETGDLSTVVTEFTGDELTENIDEVVLTGTLNDDTPVNDGDELTNNDDSPPTLNSSTPTDDATIAAVDNNIVLTFNETVIAGTGNIVISDGTDTRTIDVTDSTQVSFSGSSITINPLSDLNHSTTYHVQMAGGVITDTAGNAYAGISNATKLNFSTPNPPDTSAPTLTSSTPTDDATAVAIDNNIVLTFNETVATGTGNIIISDGADTRTIAITDATQVSFSDNTVTINPSANLNSNTTYSVQMASGVITDTTGNAYTGISDATTLNFSTPNTTPPDTAPTLSSSTPADDAIAVAVGDNIVLTFNEAVMAGTGNIVISDGGGDTRTIDVTDGTQVSFSGSSVTINPTADLNADTTYNVQIASGVIEDTANNAYVGISDTTTLNFATTDTLNPTLVSSTPTDDATTVAVDSNIVLTFSETVIAGTGNIVISDGTDTRTIDVNDGTQVNFNSSSVTINPTADLNVDTIYNLQMVSGVITDAAGNDYSGINDATTLNVDTAVQIELLTIEQNNNNGGFIINGVGASDSSGRSTSSAGDVNGDGLVDLLVGAYHDDPNGSNSGASFVVFGKTNGTTVELSDIEAGNGGFVINGVSAGDQSGLSVSSAGDVNGDGLADLILGARLDDPNGSNSGASFVIFGKTDGATVELSNIEAGNGGFVINGVSADDESGLSVSDAGDVDGDGLSDLIVGANDDDPNGASSGASFVVFGKTTGTTVELSDIEAGTGGFVINGVSTGDESGTSVSSAGDVNNDGLADLIVGANRDDPNGASSGASFVVFGKTTGTTVELSNIETGNGGFVINGISTNDQSGHSVSNAGDVNGDGLTDIIVGARVDDPNGASSGASFVVFSKTTGTTVELSNIEAGNGGFVINGVSANDYSGISVSSAGDVNGDGLADLIIGARNDDPNGIDSGASFVVFGKTTGTAVELSNIEAGNGGFTINGVSANDRSGQSVSSAGDVNGDGFADLIIGANNDDPNGGASGASFVVFGGQGSSATIGTSGNDTLIGDSNANQLVAGAGNDTLIGNSGADVLRGGAGDDILVVSDLAFASLDGGTGSDTLRFDGLLNIDLGSIANSRLSSLEIIDLNNTGSNLTLSTDDILTIVGDEARNDLRINGSNTDSLDLSNTAFFNSATTEIIDAITYDIYKPSASLNLDESVRLLVQQNISVSGARLAPIELSDIEKGNNDSGFVINGVDSGDFSGRSVSSAGDVNGDGLVDLLIGAYRDDPHGLNSGASFIVFGKNNGTAIELSDIENGNGGFVINGVSAEDQSGISVSSAGDTNGDGLTDLIIGARYDDPNGVDSGTSFVVFGTTNNTTVELSSIEVGNGGFIINGVGANDRSGGSVSNAGDVNGDGLTDLIVGANLDDPNGNDSGASFVVFGKSDGTTVELSNIEDGNGGFVINGVSTNDQSGVSVSGAGDVNGDGLADLIVGASGDDPNGAVSGASFVIFGKMNGTAVELSNTEAGNGGFVINGVSGFDRSGASVSDAGDVNGDGLTDLIIGAYIDDPNDSGSGASFVIFGKTNGTTVELSNIEAGNGGFVINGVSSNDYSGRSVSNAGDVNGDGLADLIVGARGDDPNGEKSGASFVVFGKSDGTTVELSNIENGSGGFIINGVSTGDQSGVSVSSAGDVNGDGFADMIVGAFNDDPNDSLSGASFIIFGGQGSSATVGTTSNDTLTGNGNASQLVAGAGDDTLIGNGGTDVLRGGAGDDILAVSDLTFASLDGGTGSDTLRFDAALNLDFRTLPDPKLDSIEVIDLTGDGGNSTLSLNLTDLLNLNEAQTAANTLVINGTAGDIVNLDDTSNGQTGSWADAGGSVYQFTVGGIGVVGTVTIDAAVTVNIV